MYSLLTNTVTSIITIVSGQFRENPEKPVTKTQHCKWLRANKCPLSPRNPYTDLPKPNQELAIDWTGPQIRGRQEQLWNNSHCFQSWPETEQAREKSLGKRKLKGHAY